MYIIEIQFYIFYQQTLINFCNKYAKLNSPVGTKFPIMNG